MNTSFPDIDVFYAARGGKLSGESDFGVWWTDRAARRGMPSTWPRYRVSVVHDTGDVYAKNQDSGEVELLGTFEAHSDHVHVYTDDPECPYVRAEAAFAGWSQESRDLSWLRERMAVRA